MKIFLATANCDWGHIFTDERFEASSFHTAFNRAAKQAKKQARRRPKQITISMRVV